MQSVELSKSGQLGLKALQEGKLEESYLQLLIASQETAIVDNRVLFGLAHVARAKKEFSVCLSSIDRYLQAEPKDISANIIKADALSGLKKFKTAAGFYMAAIQLAQQLPELTHPQQQEISRAEHACLKAQAIFEEEMSECLAGINFKDLGNTKYAGSSRLAQSIDIMMGKQKAYLQEPTKFYYPELPQIQFYEETFFQWTKKIKQNVGIIQNELRELMSLDNKFEPYISHNPIAPSIGNIGLEQSKEWSSFHLVQSGKEIQENIALCPKTYQLVSKAPIAKIPGKSPNILFSKLSPGAHIPPHHGQMNIRLLCHLPLIVPENCQLRVGNQIRNVIEAEWMIFDDSIEHEAFNKSNEERVVLIFDIWRPELNTKEKEALTTIFNQVNNLE